MNEELERIFEQAERECEREREIQNLKLLGEINAEIDRVKKGNAELLAQINYLKGRIDEANEKQKYWCPECRHYCTTECCDHWNEHGERIRE